MGRRCEVDIDEDCTGEAEYIVYGDESRKYCCGPCLEHAPGNVDYEKVSKSFDKAWSSITKGQPVCDICGQKLWDRRALRRHRQEAHGKYD